MSFWKSFRILAFGTVLLSPLAALAQGVINTIVPEKCQGARAAAECGICELAKLGQNVLNAAIYIMIVLSAMMFAYAGFKALTSGGNAESYSSAKRVFANVFIGLIVILGAWVLIDTVMKTLVDQGKFGPWNKICQEIENIFEHHYA